MGKLDGKIAIITGASKGIGAGIARVFTEEGACVVLAARGNDVLQFDEKLQAAGRETVVFRCDVSDAQSCKDLVDFTLKMYGTIAILDCNAGICTLSDFLTSDDVWRDAHIDINIKGVWNVCRTALPTMVRNNAGSVVITSSVTGDMVADPGEVAYATTKAACWVHEGPCTRNGPAQHQGQLHLPRICANAPGRRYGKPIGPRRPHTCHFGDCPCRAPGTTRHTR